MKKLEKTYPSPTLSEIKTHMGPSVGQAAELPTRNPAINKTRNSILLKSFKLQR